MFHWQQQNCEMWVKPREKVVVGKHLQDTRWRIAYRTSSVTVRLRSLKGSCNGAVRWVSIVGVDNCLALTRLIFLLWQTSLVEHLIPGSSDGLCQYQESFTRRSCWQRGTMALIFSSCATTSPCIYFHSIQHSQSGTQRQHSLLRQLRLTIIHCDQVTGRSCDARLYYLGGPAWSHFRYLLPSLRLHRSDLYQACQA